ncbi:MAG: metal dependent phosphohydrolase [Proteobacteria bacterium]|nr:metal dependent phosphohydrolase [Pseudomonadota bacterium]
MWKNATVISDNEGGDTEILAAAVLLHDCVAVEKNSPDRPRASRLSARKARGILADIGWEAERREKVAHAIEAHSFSAGIEPITLEARILQDADRLDAIGMIGAARCFYVAGRLNNHLYDAGDPSAEERPLNDRRFALDHFMTKLFKLCDGFKTATGRRLAAERHARLQRFYDDLLEEI